MPGSMCGSRFGLQRSERTPLELGVPTAKYLSDPLYMRAPSLKELRRAGGPSDGDADALPWITYEEGLDELPQAKWIAAATRGAAAPPALMAADAETILAAVRAGLGKSLLPCAVAEREPGLRRLGDGAPVLSRELWLLVHADLRRLARVEAMIGWVERTVLAFDTSPITARRGF
jgi:DNA-binding transcriptional LysR family regulator